MHVTYRTHTELDYGNCRAWLSYQGGVSPGTVRAWPRARATSAARCAALRRRCAARLGAALAACCRPRASRKRAAALACRAPRCASAIAVCAAACAASASMRSCERQAHYGVLHGGEPALGSAASESAQLPGTRVAVLAFGVSQLLVSFMPRQTTCWQRTLLCDEGVAGLKRTGTASRQPVHATAPYGRFLYETW